MLSAKKQSFKTFKFVYFKLIKHRLPFTFSSYFSQAYMCIRYGSQPEPVRHGCLAGQIFIKLYVLHFRGRGLLQNVLGQSGSDIL